MFACGAILGRSGPQGGAETVRQLWDRTSRTQTDAGGDLELARGDFAEVGPARRTGRQRSLQILLISPPSST